MTLTQIKPAGLSKPVDLADNEKIRLGTGNDLQIYHDPQYGHSFIKESGPGGLIFGASLYEFYNAAINEKMLTATENGAVEIYYDNSKKFETNNSGTYTTGNVSLSENIHLADDKKLFAGAGNDLQIYHDGSNSYLTNGTGLLYIRGGGDWLTLQAENGENSIICKPNGAVELYHNNSKKLETQSWGVQFYGDLENNSDSTRIKLGAGDDLQIYHDGSNSAIYDTGTGRLKLYSNGAGIDLKKDDGESMIIANTDGAVELYYDGSKVFQTHDASGYSGIDVLGDEGGHAVINLKADEGDDGADCWQWTAQTNGASYIKNLSNGSTYEYNVKMIGAGAVELYYDGVKRFETTSTGVSVNGGITTTTGSLFSDTLTFANGKGIRLAHGNQTDTNDGTIAAGPFASGLNIVGVQTGAGLGRQIRIWGHFFPATNATEECGTATQRWAKVNTDKIFFNGDTANANGLHDYEEGTWTPTLRSHSNINNTSGSYDTSENFNSGWYTKVGDMVTVSCSCDNIHNNHQNHVLRQISGLPFTASGGMQCTVSAHIGDQRGLRFVYSTSFETTNNFSLWGQISAGASMITLHAAKHDSPYSGWPATFDSTGSSRLSIQLTYKAA